MSENNLNIFNVNNAKIRKSFLTCFKSAVGSAYFIGINKISGNTANNREILVIASQKPAVWKISMNKYSKVYFLSDYPQQVLDSSKEDEDVSTSGKIVVKDYLDQDITTHQLNSLRGMWSALLSNTEITNIRNQIFSKKTLSDLNYIESENQNLSDEVINKAKSKLISDILDKNLKLSDAKEQPSEKDFSRIERTEIFNSSDKTRFEDNCVVSQKYELVFNTNNTICSRISESVVNISNSIFNHFKNRLILDRTHLMIQRVFNRDVLHKEKPTAQDLRNINFQSLKIIDNNDGKMDTVFAE